MLTPKECKQLEQRLLERLDSLIDEEEYQKTGSKLMCLIVAAFQEYEKLKDEKL